MALIGADSPAPDVIDLIEAIKALETHEAVLGAAKGGGQVVLGLRRAAASLFESMPWGGPEVAERTRMRLRKLRWRCHEPPALGSVPVRRSCPSNGGCWLGGWAPHLSVFSA